MFINRNYKLRHNLLRLLFVHDLKFKPADEFEKRGLHFSELSTFLPQYDQNILLDNLDYLRTTGEIFCSMKFDNSIFMITSTGNHSYRERKYLREGVKEQINYIYDLAKTISVIILLIIAIWTFIQNLNQVKRNKDEIDILKKELKKLELNTKRI